MNKELTYEKYKKSFHRIETVKKNMNSPEIDQIILDFAILFEIFTLDKFNIDLSVFEMSSHADIPQKSRKVRKRYYVDERGRFIFNNPGAQEGDLHSLYLLDSGTYLLVRTKKIEVWDKQGASFWDWDGTLEQYPTMAGAEHEQDIKKILSMIEERLSDSFLQNLHDMYDEIERDDIGWVIGMLLRKSFLFSTMNHFNQLHARYSKEVIVALQSLMEKATHSTISTIIHMMNQLEGPDALVDLYDSVDAKSQKTIVTELQKNPKTLITLLKLYDTLSSQRKNVTFLKEAIIGISRFSPESIEDLITALDCNAVSSTPAMTVLGTAASTGDQHALDYLLHVYTQEKDHVQKRKLASEALDRIGKRPKSWREKFF
jgi:hypothetical protein